MVLSVNCKRRCTGTEGDMGVYGNAVLGFHVVFR